MSVPDQQELPQWWGRAPLEARVGWLTLQYDRSGLLSMVLGRADLAVPEEIDGGAALDKQQLAGIYAAVTDFSHHPDFNADFLESHDDPAGELADRYSRNALATMLLQRAGVDDSRRDYTRHRLTRDELAAIYNLLGRSQR